jgi:hypothetical protein
MPRLETRDRPAPGGPSAFGGTRRGRPRRWALSAFQARRLCPHAVIIPQIGTNTCGWSPAPSPQAGASYPNARPRASWARPRFVCSNAGFECCLKSRELGSGLRTLPAPTVMLKRQTADFKLRIRFLIRTHSRQRFSQPAMSFCDARPTQSSFDGSAARSCSSSTRLAAILTIFSTRGDLRAAAAKYALDQVRAKFGRSTPEKQRHGLNGKAWCS